jgi:hypothetical protein
MTRDEKSELIREQKASGLTQAEFCKIKSIRINSFHEWKAFEKRRAKPLFVELTSKTTQPQPIVISAGLFRIEVPVGFDKSHLAAVLSVIPC